MKLKKSFASDNNAPVHESVFRAMLEANHGDAIAYGDDPYTQEAEQKFKELFGSDISVYFVFNGTGANVAAVSHLTRSYHSIVCSDVAHMQHDECGAPEKFSGSKLQVLPAPDGKITPEQIEPLLHSLGFQHHSQPRLISITQATELGTVYTREEIIAIARFAHHHDLYLHVDGARVANAAAFLNLTFEEMITDCGVDVLSFGGTKNGIMLGEAVVFLNPRLAREFEYTRKQSMQLASKMRYISAQFTALLSNSLWLQNAHNANRMARRLAQQVEDIPGVIITQPVQINAVFAKIPADVIETLQKQYFFYVWDHEKSIVRWMTSFNTTEKDVDDFVEALKVALKV
ncbi:MAG: low specificity L-threonine aldolase [Bacteroidales bacterium]